MFHRSSRLVSYDDKQLVYVTGQTDAKLVLIDNLFK